ELVFFFSSRRRHTRSDRDWSSDVCSSDLFSRLKDALQNLITSGESIHQQPKRNDEGSVGGRHRQQLEVHHRDGGERAERTDHERSEERRVGKECRSRWWPYQ